MKRKWILYFLLLKFLLIISYSSATKADELNITNKQCEKTYNQYLAFKGRDTKFIEYVKNEIKYLQAFEYKSHPDEYEAVYVYMLSILLEDVTKDTVDNIKPIYMATYKFISEQMISHNKREVLDNFISGQTKGFDGTLLDLLIIRPISAFVINKAPPKNIGSISENKKLEKRLQQLMLNEELESFLKGKTTKFFDNIQYHSISEISDSYKKNEVKGDLTYKGKNFITKGTIASIESSLYDKPAITFKTDDMEIIRPTAFFYQSDSKLDRISNLNIGDDIVLACTGGGEMVSSPILSDCIFIDELEEFYMSALERDGYKQFNPAYDIRNISLSIKAISSLLPKNSSCLTDDLNACKFEIFNLPDEEIKFTTVQMGLSDNNVKNYTNAVLKAYIDALMKKKDAAEPNSSESLINDCIYPIMGKIY